MKIVDGRKEEAPTSVIQKSRVCAVHAVLLDSGTCMTVADPSKHALVVLDAHS
jgi:hypothetical protein